MSFQCCPASGDLPERWVFQDRGVEATLVPSAGMNLTSLGIGGVPFLDLPSSLGEFMKHVQTGGVPLLHPWANRLRGDGYVAGGSEVDLSGFTDLKRDDNGLPIHGLVLRSPDFQVDVDGGRSVVGSLDWGPGVWGFEAFPFPHMLRVRWEIVSIPGSVRAVCTMSVDAGERDVPLGSGWHPYFAPGGLDRDTPLEVHSPSLRKVALDHLGLPVREGGDLTMLGEKTFDGPLGETAYDDLFIAPVDGWEVEIRRGSARISIAADEQWPMLQIYAPVDAGYACVEPMLAPTAALSDGRARIVPTGQSFSASFSLHAECIEP